MYYKFPYTEDNGYYEVFISKKDHNETWKYRQIKYCDKYRYFYNPNKGYLVLRRCYNLLAQVIETCMFPSTLLYHGIGNYKEVKSDVSRVFNQLEKGSFRSDDCWRGRNCIVDPSFEEIMKKFKRFK